MIIDKVWEQKFPGEPWKLEPRKHGGQQAEHQNGELEIKTCTICKTNPEAKASTKFSI